MKKTFHIILTLFVIMLNIVCIFQFSPKTIQTTSSEETGKIVVTVLEKGSNNPIDNATICLIESHTYHSTNKNGVSNIIEVPILPNHNFDSSLKRTWGEITILAYKPGYSDHIMFYQEVPVSQTRLGIIIHLSPIYSSSDTVPTISTNAPNNTWVQELIRLYKK